MTVVGCIIPAAGRGERLGGPLPKALRQLGGITLLEHSIRAIAAERSVREIVIAAPVDYVAEMRSLADSSAVDARIRVVAGGAERTDSVRKGLESLTSDPDVVLVHDAARPLVPLEVTQRVIAACDGGAAAVVPGIAVTDTIKQVDEAGRVVRTVPRADLRAIQTPQGFRSSVLRDALAVDHVGATDDASLVELLGLPVLVVPGHHEALKVTRPHDLVIAEAILRRRQVDHVR